MEQLVGKYGYEWDGCEYNELRAWLMKENEMAKGKDSKVHKVMGEFKRHTLHSGSKKGPVVKSRRQAVAIALSEARRGKK